MAAIIARVHRAADRRRHHRGPVGTGRRRRCLLLASPSDVVDGVNGAIYGPLRIAQRDVPDRHVARLGLRRRPSPTSAAALGDRRAALPDGDRMTPVVPAIQVDHVVALVRQRRRRQRRLVRAGAGHHRAAGSERGREDHAAPPAGGPAGAVSRGGPDRRSHAVRRPTRVFDGRSRARARGGAGLPDRSPVRALQCRAAVRRRRGARRPRQPSRPSTWPMRRTARSAPTRRACASA